MLLSADLPGGLSDPDNLPGGVIPLSEPPIIAEVHDWNEIDSAAAQSRELVIVDAATPGYETLVNDLVNGPGDERTFEVVVLDADRDGLTQVSELLGERSGLSAVHIISHGDDGQLALGNSMLDYDGLIENAKTIQSWGDAFTADGDLLIYGCNLAAGSDGRAFINTLGLLTDADVAASSDLTGDATQGGDWDLEYQRGTVEAGVAVSAEAAAGQLSKRAWPSRSTRPAPARSPESPAVRRSRIRPRRTTTDSCWSVFRSVGTRAEASAPSPTTATSATLVGVRENGAATRMEIWSLVAPDSGTHNVQVNLTAPTAERQRRGDRRHDFQRCRSVDAAGDLLIQMAVVVRRVL